MTFAEEYDEPKIDWEKEIKSLIKNFNESRYTELEGFAYNWRSCPIGQLNTVIKRGSNGEPKDAILLKTRRLFELAFEQRNLEEALNLTQLIKLRGKKVLEDTVSDFEESIDNFYHRLGKKSPLSK